MIKGIGVDIEKINRFNDLLAKRILSEEEYRVYLNKNTKKLEYLASRFSAKEAFFKAYGKKFSFQDISILNDLEGKPYISFPEFSDVIHLSISHTDELVIAYVIIEDKS